MKVGMCEPQKFHTLFWYSPMENEFVIGGIFSKREDAETEKEAALRDPAHAGAVSIQLLPMEQIKTFLLKDRLRTIAMALEKLVPEAFPRTSLTAVPPATA